MAWKIGISSEIEACSIQAVWVPETVAGLFFEERRAQGEALADGGEGVAGPDPVFTETIREDAADIPDERTASGQEDAIDCVRIDSGPGQGGVESCGDRGRDGGGHLPEFVEIEGFADRDDGVGKSEVGSFLGGQTDLGAFDLLKEGEAEIAADEGKQAGEALRLIGSADKVFQFFDQLDILVEEGNPIPLADLVVGPGRDGQDLLPAEFAVGGVASEEGGELGTT